MKANKNVEALLTSSIAWKDPFEGRRIRSDDSDLYDRKQCVLSAALHLSLTLC